MVILMVLATLLMLIIFTLQLGDSSTALHHLEERTRQREQNYQVARSAVELAMDLLKVDEIDVDSARDAWALGSQSLRWEGRDRPRALCSGPGTSAHQNRRGGCPSPGQPAGLDGSR